MIVATASAPHRVLSTEPRPPEIAVPPTSTAAIASKATVPSRYVDAPVLNAPRNAPPIAIDTPARAKAAVTTRAIGIPPPWPPGGSRRQAGSAGQHGAAQDVLKDQRQRDHDVDRDGNSGRGGVQRVDPAARRLNDLAAVNTLREAIDEEARADNEDHRVGVPGADQQALRGGDDRGGNDGDRERRHEPKTERDRNTIAATTAVGAMASDVIEPTSVMNVTPRAMMPTSEAELKIALMLAHVRKRWVVTASTSTTATPRWRRPRGPGASGEWGATRGRRSGRATAFIAPPRRLRRRRDLHPCCG